MEREKHIIKTSIIGIIANIALASFKAVVGLLSRSVAITLDAVNNLSDALSSIITIIGTKIANKKPDKKHPLGHGRVEYLSTLVISIIILYAGVTALIESVKKIINPETPDYSKAAIIIVTVAIFVKIFLGLYVKKKGEEYKSDALKASGTDALFDSIISTATLVAAIIFITTGFSLESYLGVVISIIIIKSGIDMIRETISEILGERVDPDIARKVKGLITEFPDVNGAYDLVIHNYGPEKLIGSVHIEVPEKMTARELDKLGRQITAKVFMETGVAMTGVSVYSINSEDKEAVQIEKDIKEICLSHEGVLEVHGFYLEREDNTIRFDVIIDYDIKDRESIYTHITSEIAEKYPDYQICPLLDVDMSE